MTGEVFGILFLTIVAPIWIVSHYISKAKASRGLTTEDETMLTEMWESAKKMEERITTLERILDEDFTGLEGALMKKRRLYRDPDRRWIGGVCAGIANHLAVPVFWVRLMMLLPLFSPLFPVVALAYLIMVLRIPVEPEGLYETPEHEAFTRSAQQAPSSTFGEVRHRMRDIEHRIRRMEAYVTSTEFKFRD